MEQNVHIDRKVLVGVSEHEEVEELTVVEEEEPVKGEALLLQVLMSLLLHDKIVLGQFGEDLDAIFDHQIIHGVRVPVRTPHDAAELGASLKEVALLVREDVREKPRVINRIDCHPVLLRLDPLVKVV